MKNRFSRLALLATMAACWTTAVKAQDVGPPKAPSPASVTAITEASETRKVRLPRGQQLLLDAKRRTDAHITVESQMRVRTHLMGQLLVGSGEYAQLRSSQGLLLRLELAIQAGGQATSIKQVCDGRHMWVHRRVGETESLRHIDLLRVERAIAASPVAIGLEHPMGTLASGGLPKLLARLADHFDFDRAPLRRGQLSQVPVWIATGVWKPEKLASVAPHAVNGGQIVLEELGGHLPHQVEIQLGQSDLFPYKLTYQRWETKDGHPQLVPAVTTEFFEVTLGGELDARQFIYHRPSNIGVADDTDLYLQNVLSASRPSTDDFR